MKEQLSSTGGRVVGSKVRTQGSKIEDDRDFILTSWVLEQDLDLLGGSDSAELVLEGLKSPRRVLIEG